MSKTNKNEEAQRQLQLAKLDEMLWLSTPLGKFMSSMSQQAKKVFPSSKTHRYTQRDWVVRIPNSFVTDSSKGSPGFQTVVTAETPDQALEAASVSNTWEVLDFSVSDFQVFPNTPL
ncbi:hypothetical protein [Prochlorococcus marinus]|uniref:hypothetical protein n=1 Tax=Prochlorococcus marinus TaxID=1219 RepID=UPI0039B0E235